MSELTSIRIGLLGCGTVGTGVLRILAENREDIQARLGAELVVTRILVHDLDRQRDESVPRALLTDDPLEVLGSPEVDVVAEVMGGYEPARSYVLAALKNGKHVITANKALLAQHGPEIFQAATDAKRDVIFEASVGGGMPIVRMLREGLAAEHVESICAIINGTSNYILSAMAEHGASYDAALARAQELGFAEADPTLDVGGGDAAQKLSILVSLAFGRHVPFAEIPTQGIDTVEDLDIGYARTFGYAIKPLALAQSHGDGVEARVHPALVERGGSFATVSAAFNAVRVDSRGVGPLLLQGQGAGMLPTASAVVSDAVELGRSFLRGTSGRLPHLAFLPDGRPTTGLKDPGAACHPWYLRVPVRDEPGVLAQVAKGLGDAGVSVQQILQDRPSEDGPVQVVMMTQEATRSAITGFTQDAHEALWCLGAVQAIPIHEGV